MIYILIICFCIYLGGWRVLWGMVELFLCGAFIIWMVNNDVPRAIVQIVRAHIG